MLLTWWKGWQASRMQKASAEKRGSASTDTAPQSGDEPHKPLPELWFFGGKGGVGKTSCAAAQALALAEAGEATLLVSTDPAHNLGDLFGPLDGHPRTIAPQLEVMELDPEQECERYLEVVRQRIAPLVSGERSATVMRQLTLARHAPGTSEAALFDALVEIILAPPSPLSAGNEQYRHIIFDTAPSGHTIRLLSLPEVLGGWLDGMLGQRKRAVAERSLWLDSQDAVSSTSSTGTSADDPISEALEQRRTRYAALRVRLTDAHQVRVILVSTPEKLPCLETQRTREALEAHGMTVGGLIINQCLPEMAQPCESEAGISQARAPREAAAEESEWVTTWREQQHHWANELDKAFADRPCLRLMRQSRLPEDRESLVPLMEALASFTPWPQQCGQAHGHSPEPCTTP
ncbi:ArsA family ATPase [Cobetia sp. L2A1]|uniref:ArsA family ATPase n=1 Tax=Cobetia sp. L2A1 TaxID=2686360 RepID=UPI00131B0212|nr:TRC40/GET3/ArsA family transport-energizing ATPase [Cobetia sp. L2A1]